MLRRAGLAGAIIALALSWAGTALAASAAEDSPFKDWAAVVIAGDFHGSDGGPTEVFDNARRDVTKELKRIGFAPDNMAQFSVRPERYGKDKPLKSEPRAIYEKLKDLSGKTQSGCLVYFTSHGAPQGVLVDQQILSPNILGRILDATCAGRPTVVIMSACFSGVFVRPLAQPNRMILTAARPDRTSFGCGADNVYPYFDDCVLSSSPIAKDFIGLASAVKTCVALREITEGAKPPSEPQIWIGAELRPMLPLYAFPTGPPKGG